MATQKELDQLYDKLDKALREERFVDFDRALYYLDPWSMDFDEVLTYLTISLPARSKLPSRSAFFWRTHAMLEAKEMDVDGLLGGLEK